MNQLGFLMRTALAAVAVLVCGVQPVDCATGPVPAVVDPIVPAVAAPNNVRIGYVSIRDYSGRSVDTAAVNRQLSDHLTTAGFETVKLEFQPPAELEAAARHAGCQYVLYAEVLDVRQPIFDKLAGALHAKTTHAEVEIEFRLFGMDEILPRVSTSLAGRGKARGQASSMSRLSRSARRNMSAFAPLGTGTADETSKLDALRAAFDAVFEKQVRLVAAGVRRGPVHMDVDSH